MIALKAKSFVKIVGVERSTQQAKEKKKKKKHQIYFRSKYGILI